MSVNINNSCLVKLINKLLDFIQKNSFNVLTKSFIIKNIDLILLLSLFTLLIGITFLNSSKIAILLISSFFILIIKLLFSKGQKFELNTIDISVICYVAILGLSVVFSDMQAYAIKGYAKILIYFFAYLSFSIILKIKPKYTLVLLSFFAVTAFFESITAIWQNFADLSPLATWQDTTGINYEQIMKRVYGTLKPYNPNLLAGYLVPAFGITLGLSFYFLREKKIIKTLFFFITFLLTFVALVFTASRGAYLAVMFMLLALVLISGHIIWNEFSGRVVLKKIWTYLIASGLLSAIILIGSSPALQHRILSIFTLRGDSSNSFRMNVYLSSIEMLKDNWLTGIGPGSDVFRETYGLYMVTGYDALGAYSVPLEISIEGGVFAILAFVWLVGLIFFKSFNYILFEKDLSEKIIISSCVIALTGILVHGIVDTIFFRPQVQIIFWLIISVLATKFTIYDKSVTKN